MEYARPKPVWLLDEEQTAQLRRHRDELRAVVLREEASGRAVNTKARLRTVERQLALAEQSRVEASRRTHAVTAEATPCGLRAQQSAVAELRQLLDEFDTSQPGAANGATQEFMQPVPYWAEPARSPNAFASNSASSFAERWARVYESVHRGERAFATS